MPPLRLEEALLSLLIVFVVLTVGKVGRLARALKGQGRPAARAPQTNPDGKPPAASKRKSVN